MNTSIAIRHIAGQMSDDGLQVCAICGYQLCDFRNAVSVGGFHKGWPAHESVFVTGSQPITFTINPITPFEDCKPISEEF